MREALKLSFRSILNRKHGFLFPFPKNSQFPPTSLFDFYYPRPSPPHPLTKTKYLAKKKGVLLICMCEQNKKTKMLAKEKFWLYYSINSVLY